MKRIPPSRLCLFPLVLAVAASVAPAHAGTTGAAGRQAASRQVMEKWETRLAKRTEIEVKSGGRPTVRLTAMNRTARVVAVTGATLMLSAGGATVSQEVSRMTPEEKASLAESLAGGAGGEQEAAMAAFFLFAAGDKAAAGAALGRAGSYADEVRQAFPAAPVPVAEPRAPTPAGPSGPVTVEATLKAMSKVPTLKDLDTYSASLIACEWQVDRAVKGALSVTGIIVYHWSFLERKPQAAAGWRPGVKRTLVLRPREEVTELDMMRVDEDVLAGRPDLPAFYDTALGVGLPAALTAGAGGATAPAGAIGAVRGGAAVTGGTGSSTLGKLLENARKPLSPAVLVVNGADCHGLNDLHLLYGGAGKGKAVSVGGAGTSFQQHELGYRVAAAECPKLEWGIQSGGADRPCGGFGGAGYPLLFPDGPAWPPLAGRGPAPKISGDNEVTVLPGVERGHVESLGVLQNCIREYGRRGKGFMLDLEFRSDGQYLRAGRNDAVHERFLSWGKVYPNFLYFHIYDPDAVRAQVKAGHTVSCATLEKGRVAMVATGWPPKLMAWSADPPDPRPDPAALARAVGAGGAGGVVVVGGAWIARVMAGAPGMAAFANAGIAEAELVLRSAVAAGRKPGQVVWGIEPLMLTAPKTERAIAPLPGPDWPAVGKERSAIRGVRPILLGHGTTVARGSGVWEFGLEYSLILEAALRELERHQIGAVLALGPNDVRIPDRAYEGLADRLRACTVVFPGTRFVEPSEIAGKAESAARAVIQAHLADPARGVLKSKVPARGGY